MVLCVAGPVSRDTVLGRPARLFRACRAARVSRAAGAPAGRARAAVPRRAQRVGADPGPAFCFTPWPETDPGYHGAARRSCACSTTACRRGCTTKSATRRGSPTRWPGRCSSYHDAALLEIDAACSHPSCPRWSPRPGDARPIPRGAVTEAELDKAKRRFVSDLEAWYDDLDGLCGWFGGTELYYRAETHENGRGRWRGFVPPTCAR